MRLVRDESRTARMVNDRFNHLSFDRGNKGMASVQYVIAIGNAILSCSHITSVQKFGEVYLVG